MEVVYVRVQTMAHARSVALAMVGLDAKVG